jgi:hypothetical protein
MNKKEDILSFLRQRREEIRKKFSVKRIGLFGSVLREAEDASSDIDILVEFEQPTFDHYMELKFFLEDSFGRPVDLVLADSLKPRLKPIISQEVTYA